MRVAASTVLLYAARRRLSAAECTRQNQSESTTTKPLTTRSPAVARMPTVLPADTHFLGRKGVGTPILGEQVSVGGSAVVPLDRALVSSHRLSIVTLSLTEAVWPQFAMQVFRGGCHSQYHARSGNPIYVFRQFTVGLRCIV